MPGQSDFSSDKWQPQGRECTLAQPLQKTEWRSVLKLRTELPCEPVILPLALHPKERNQYDEEETGGVASRVLVWDTQIPEFHPQHCMKQGVDHTPGTPELKRQKEEVQNFPDRRASWRSLWDTGDSLSENKVKARLLFSHVHFSTTHSSQDGVNRTHSILLIDGQTKKSGVPFSLIKEANPPNLYHQTSVNLEEVTLSKENPGQKYTA